MLENGRVVPLYCIVLPEHSCVDYQNECQTDEIIFKILIGGM